MTPFFQASRHSLAYQFTIIAPLLCPPFSNFRKVFHFQPCFGQNFSSQDANFPNFRSLDPSFFKENLLPRPYFWNIPTKKKVECPPPPGAMGTYQFDSLFERSGENHCHRFAEGLPNNERTKSLLLPDLSVMVAPYVTVPKFCKFLLGQSTLKIVLFLILLKF